MNKRENAFVEAMKAIKENNDALVDAADKALQEKVDQKNNWKKKYYATLESREEKLRFHGKLLESAKDHALCDSLKAIYITALEKYSGLSEDEYLLAESLVEGWVKENGGASAIFNKSKDDSYLLHRLSEIVTEAAHRAVTEVESIAEADDDSKEDDSKEEVNDTKPEDNNTITINGVKYVKADNQEESDEDSDDDDSDEDKDYSDEIDNSDDKEDTEDPSDSDGINDDVDSDEYDNTEEEDESDDLEVPDDDDDDDTSDNNGEPKDLDDELLDDNDDDDDDSGDDSDDDDSDDEKDYSDEIDHTVEKDNDKEEPEVDVDDSCEGCEDDDVESDKLYKDLENEEDVQKAIDTIHDRVADAEEKFIKKNAEDKKKVDDLLHKINDNIKTVEEIDDKDNPKSKVAEEAVRLAKREINDITEKGVKTVFESMANEISKSIYLNESVKESYTDENGKIDTDAVVGRTRVMYGFLETLNTLKLEKVDQNYIQRVIDGIN